MNNGIKIFLGFAAGAAAGALTGILLAPNSGKKTRKMISKEADKMKDDITDSVVEKLDTARDKYNSMVEEYAQLGKEALSQVRSKAKLNNN